MSIRFKIGKVHVAYYTPLIPSVHGVYGFRELCATFLVDAASVYPCIPQSAHPGDLQHHLDLYIPSFMSVISSLVILGRHLFFFFPSVRQYGIPGYFAADELFEFAGSSVYQSHGEPEQEKRRGVESLVRLQELGSRLKGGQRRYKLGLGAAGRLWQPAHRQPIPR